MRRTLGVSAVLVALAATLGGGYAVAAPPPNPAAQEQVSLEEAAQEQVPEISLAEAQKLAPGQVAKVEKPVRTERTDKLKPSKRVDPAEVMSDLAANGGCLVEYGEPGQCLPASMTGIPGHEGHAVASFWQCDDVRALFPEGIKVKGDEDPHILDLNQDGVGCGPGD